MEKTPNEKNSLLHEDIIKLVDQLRRENKEMPIEEFKKFAYDSAPTMLRTVKKGEPFKRWKNVVDDYCKDLSRVENYMNVKK